MLQLEVVIVLHLPYEQQASINFPLQGDNPDRWEAALCSKFVTPLIHRKKHKLRLQKNFRNLTSLHIPVVCTTKNITKHFLNNWATVLVLATRMCRVCFRLRINATCLNISVAFSNNRTTWLHNISHKLLFCKKNKMFY